MTQARQADRTLDKREDDVSFITNNKKCCELTQWNSAHNWYVLGKENGIRHSDKVDSIIFTSLLEHLLLFFLVVVAEVLVTLLLFEQVLV